jgi:hypothetical protein
MVKIISWFWVLSSGDGRAIDKFSISWLIGHGWASQGPDTPGSPNGLFGGKLFQGEPPEIVKTGERRPLSIPSEWKPPVVF